MTTIGFVRLPLRLPTAVWKLLCTLIRSAPCAERDVRSVAGVSTSPPTTGLIGCAERMALDRAKVLRERHSTSVGRFKLHELMEHEGIVLEYADFGRPMHYDRQRQKHVITLPRRTSMYRDNYAIAADIGRVVLMLPLDDGKDRYNARLCNIFAAELLMPEERIRHYVRAGLTDKSMSEMFGVLESAVTIRRHILGLKENKECQTQ